PACPRRTPSPPLFPYTTLFRSQRASHRRGREPRSPAPQRSPSRGRGSRSARYLTSPSASPSPPSRISRTARTSSSPPGATSASRSEEHTSELQALRQLVCRLLL